MPGTDTTLNAVIASQNTLKTIYADFNTAYGKYLICKDANPSYKSTCVNGGDSLSNYYINGVSINTYSPSLQTKTDALYQQLGNSPSAVNNTELQEIIALNSALGVVGTPVQFDASYNSIKLKRAQLDQKLQELYNVDNSIPQLYQSQLDSTVYSGILWTVLATTLLYYVFIKL